MKLYATVASERASKGQGGQSLMIQIQGEDGIILARLYVNQSEAEPDQYEMSIENRAYCLTIVEDGQEIETKGEKQKGEACGRCYDCEAPTGYACGTTPDA